MAKTASILSTEEWKASFGGLIAFVASTQGISALEIARQLDAFEGSTGKRRAGDWSRYVHKGRVPTEESLKRLAPALRVPTPVLRACAGYVDDIFECSYAAISNPGALDWPFPISQAKAVFAFLFSLFPSEEDMHIGWTGSLYFWIIGSVLKANLSSEEGFLTGEGWNATWLYPVRSVDHLVEHNERADDPSRTWIFEEKPPGAAWTWYSLRALLQVDLASPIASAILERERLEIPNNNLLSEARMVLHRTAMPLTMRLTHASEIVHHWANEFDEELASEVREHLQPWSERTITGEAAKWIRADLPVTRIEADAEGDMPRYLPDFHTHAWEVGNRPEEFWL